MGRLTRSTASTQVRVHGGLWELRRFAIFFYPARPPWVPGPVKKIAPALFCLPTFIIFYPGSGVYPPYAAAPVSALGGYTPPFRSTYAGIFRTDSNILWTQVGREQVRLHNKIFRVCTLFFETVPDHIWTIFRRDSECTLGVYLRDSHGSLGAARGCLGYLFVVTVWCKY